MAALDDRIGSQFGRNQVIEAFHELGAGERLRDDGRGRETVQLFRDWNRFIASMTVLPFQLGRAFALRA